jgi:hypothetical protein
VLQRREMPDDFVFAQPAGEAVGNRLVDLFP